MQAVAPALSTHRAALFQGGVEGPSGRDNTTALRAPGYDAARLLQHRSEAMPQMPGMNVFVLLRGASAGLERRALDAAAGQFVRRVRVCHPASHSGVAEQLRRARGGGAAAPEDLRLPLVLYFCPLLEIATLLT